MPSTPPLTHFKSHGDQHIAVKGSVFSEEAASILSREALSFVELLVETFGLRLEALLEKRNETQVAYDHGQLPDFRQDTKAIRDDSGWQVAEVPNDLLDRRVEITGPIDRKMVINALNSGANVFMCCFEDATSPTWENMVNGQINMRAANNGSIAHVDPKSGKSYSLGENPATLIMRPRGLHLKETHIQFNGKPIPGCLMDAGLYFFHNYAARAKNGQGVYFYIPKLESMEEAAWWNDVFTFMEKHFDVPTGTIRATVLIETLPAVFQMEEILYALKDHIVGMNCGRWDYIFSYIKTLKHHGDRVLPDRHSVGMDTPFLDAYSKRLIQTCHRRGALAIGGMSAFIPSKDPDQVAFVTQKVIEDKQRESANGHDGTWVAHPHLVTLAREIFDQALNNRPNQRHVIPEGDFNADSLLSPCKGPKDEAGVRKNIRIAVLYMEAWLRGVGCVPIFGLMEDAATAEISRANIWQWLKHQVQLDDGRLFTDSLFKQWLEEETIAMKAEVMHPNGEQDQTRKFDEASAVFYQLSTDADFADFLTLPCYEMLE
ncbi:malate synthase A [Enterovibrio baiacu]|uniref:malate synthase A n=1 Tax=Enterovibrio baiacu TaxID=2491023 RepID=UPI003D10ECD2